MHLLLAQAYSTKTQTVRISLSLLLLISLGADASAQTPEQPRWAAEVKAVSITRDDWGIAHVHGRTDADAVFGMVYAQCEDDFHRVERNYLTSLGRTAEADGEMALWADLRQRLFVDPEELRRDYAGSPEWLRRLMDAWADGLNFYLAQHPAVKPQVLTRFEPWMALSFTEGSIGGDIERVDLGRLREFYGGAGGVRAAEETQIPFGNDKQRGGGRQTEVSWVEPEPSGSNGIAIAPANTRDHHALLLINPHTSFFFRSELQMASDEGLNAYGAVTWGQFFVYQGFNERAGWMHTSSGVDAVDEFVETVVDKERHPVPTPRDTVGDLFTLYGGATRPVVDKTIALQVRTSTGMSNRTFTAHYTTHGPVVRADGDGRWVAIKLMNLPVPALEQSYLRTKARTYAEYRKTMELQANSSNNTLFADADGDIAYWHGNFIPRRSTRFDYTKPVDGADAASDWNGLLPLGETPQLHNPASGYVFNVNDSPWNGAGANSLRKADFPVYVERGIESARGVHAMRVLGGKKDFTLESLQAAAYDSYLPWFARTLPGLLAAYDALPAGAAEGAREQIALLRGWNYRWAGDSVATSLAVYWGTELMKTAGPGARKAGVPSEEYVVASMPPAALLAALGAASAKLVSDFGSWQTPWGEINRFQRLTDDLAPTFNDAGASLPVPFPSALWGSLASFGARQYPGTKKWYGTSGNSFVAVVEFGPRVRARAVTAGGESGDPAAKHFDDEAQRYAGGNLREVYFYADQLKGHTERVYRPGE